MLAFTSSKQFQIRYSRLRGLTGRADRVLNFVEMVSEGDVKIVDAKPIEKELVMFKHKKRGASEIQPIQNCGYNALRMENSLTCSSILQKFSCAEGENDFADWKEKLLLPIKDISKDFAEWRGEISVAVKSVNI